jgi:hypothetical protein
VFQFPDGLRVTEQQFSHSEENHEIEDVEPEALKYFATFYHIGEGPKAKLFVFELEGFFLYF